MAAVVHRAVEERSWVICDAVAGHLATAKTDTVEIVEHRCEDDLERYANADSSGDGIGSPGRASSDLCGVPGSADGGGSVRGGDAFGGGEDQTG
jgi:hypothetical protein